MGVVESLDGFVDMYVHDRVTIVIRGLLKCLYKKDKKIQTLEYTIVKKEIEAKNLNFEVMKMKFKKQFAGDNKFQIYKGVLCSLVVAAIFVSIFVQNVEYGNWKCCTSSIKFGVQKLNMYYGM